MMKNSLLLLLLMAAPLNAATIFIDFGSTSTTNGNGPTTGSSPTWNNVTTIGGHTTPALNDSVTGLSTGYTLTLSGAFQGPASEVPKPASSPYPTTATGDAFFHNVARTLTLNNLNPAFTYNITLFGFISRTTTREAAVTIGGVTQTYQASNLRTGGTDAAPVDPANPNGGSTTFTNITPELDGTIDIDIDRAAGNTNFYILSGMEINYTIPEPAIALLGSLGLIPFLRRRR